MKGTQNSVASHSAVAKRGTSENFRETSDIFIAHLTQVHIIVFWI